MMSDGEWVNVYRGIVPCGGMGVKVKGKNWGIEATLDKVRVLWRSGQTDTPLKRGGGGIFQKTELLKHGRESLFLSPYFWYNASIL
jgi:hypothetical protein